MHSLKFVLIVLLSSSLGVFANTASEYMKDPGMLANYCKQRFGQLPETDLDELVVSMLEDVPGEQELSTQSLQRMCEELRFLATLDEGGAQLPESTVVAGGADCGPVAMDYAGPSNNEIRTLSADIAQVVAFMEKDRRQKGSNGQRAIFRLADGLIDQQLKVFSDVNGLNEAADRSDKFLVRTVKDIELDEAEFKKRALIMDVTLEILTENYKRTGKWREPSYKEIEKRLAERGHKAKGGDASFGVLTMRVIKEEMDQGWNVGEAIPPKGNSRSLANQMKKFEYIRKVAQKALDDKATIPADEFYYFSFFIPSQKQQTTTFVQPSEGGPYLPFKQSKVIGYEPKLSQAMGTKLFQGDIKQPEGFMEASWGAASANLSTRSGQWMYYRAHVNYGSDKSENDREKLRSKLRASGMTGNKGGSIRIHADVGSLGCLELPIEDSVGITGLAKSGNKPQMQTIPFPFTQENLNYFGSKIEGHGDFWRKIAEEEEKNFSYEKAMPIDEILLSAKERF